MNSLHEEEKLCQQLPEYHEQRMVIESETASLASDGQQLPEDSMVEDFPEADQPSSTDLASLDRDFPHVLESLTSNAECSFNLSSLDIQKDVSDKELESEKMHVDDEKPDSLIKENCTPLDTNLNQGFGYKKEENSHMNNGSTIETTQLPIKRKHNAFTENGTSPCSKSPKGESSVSLDMDNSSDSGISGDLAEETDGQGDAGITNQKDNPGNSNDNNKYFVSSVHKLFGGKLLFSTKCLNCKTESIQKDTFTDLNLTFKSGPETSKEPKPPIPMEDLIARYLTTELLCGNNSYECEKCDSKQNAEKSTKIIEAPEHLILTQLRVYYDKNTKHKIFDKVDIKEELFLPLDYSVSILSDDDNNDNFIKSEGSQSNNNVAGPSKSSENVYDKAPRYEKYSLYAVIVHAGLTSETGHYFCYARRSCFTNLRSSNVADQKRANTWYNFNDERVTEASFDEVTGKSDGVDSRKVPYVLIYKRISNTLGVNDIQSIPQNTSDLPEDLAQAVEIDNLNYHKETGPNYRYVGNPSVSICLPRNDNEDDPPPPSVGGGGGGGFEHGGGSLHTSSRIVF